VPILCAHIMGHVIEKLGKKYKFTPNKSSPSFEDNIRVWKNTLIQKMGEYFFPGDSRPPPSSIKNYRSKHLEKKILPFLGIASGARETHKWKRWRDFFKGAGVTPTPFATWENKTQRSKVRFSRTWNSFFTESSIFHLSAQPSRFAKNFLSPTAAKE